MAHIVLTKIASNVSHELFELTVDNISIFNPDIVLDITFYTVLEEKKKVSPISSDSLCYLSDVVPCKCRFCSDILVLFG